MGCRPVFHATWRCACPPVHLPPATQPACQHFSSTVYLTCLWSAPPANLDCSACLPTCLALACLPACRGAHRLWAADPRQPAAGLPSAAGDGGVHLPRGTKKGSTIRLLLLPLLLYHICPRVLCIRPGGKHIICFRRQLCHQLIPDPAGEECRGAVGHCRARPW